LVTPQLRREIIEAAQALAEDDWLDLRSHRDSESGILITTPSEAVNNWVLRGLQHDLGQK